MQKLVENSDEALTWLEKQGVDLGLKAQLGGHKASRTYRPEHGSFIGAELIFVLENKLRKFEKEGRLTIFTGMSVDALVTETDKEGQIRVVGV